MKDKKLRKSADKKWKGVCGGFGEWIGIDPTIIRIAYALLTFFTFGLVGVIVYLILAAVMPEPESTTPLQ